eukprot:Selendium_serpulae@DN824_c0_g1_i2.p3
MIPQRKTMTKFLCLDSPDAVSLNKNSPDATSTSKTEQSSAAPAAAVDTNKTAVATCKFEENELKIEDFEDGPESGWVTGEEQKGEGVSVFPSSALSIASKNQGVLSGCE